jgi:Tol biopolymer transport system component
MTSNPYGDDTPMAYSPNGERLVFARYDQNGNSVGLFVVKTDGTGLRQIAPAGVTCCNGGWSPQGNNIVFSRLRDARRAQLDVDRACQRHEPPGSPGAPGIRMRRPELRPERRRLLRQCCR